MEEKPLTVQITLGPNDVYTPFQWSRGNLGRWVAGLFLAYVFYDLIRNKSDALLSFDSGKSVLAILVILAAFIVLGLLLFPYLRFLAHFRKFPDLKRSRRITFAINGIGTESDLVKSEWRWASILEVFETGSLFVLTYSTGGAMYVPKRCFSSRDDIVRLRQIIREAMPGKWSLHSD